MRLKHINYIIHIFLPFIVLKNVHASLDLQAAINDGTNTEVPEVPTTTIRASQLMTRVPPPRLITYPGIKFEGVDYEDNRHVMHRYPFMPEERWRCWYQQLRCIRYQTNAKPVCTVDRYRMIYSFISICEMMYYNCLLNYARFYYNGDDRECYYIWDVAIINPNEELAEQYGYTLDKSHAFTTLDYVYNHPRYWCRGCPPQT